MFSVRLSRLFAVVWLLPLPLFANVAPVVTTPIDDATLYQNAGALVVPLPEHFNDSDTSGVRLTTDLGDVDLVLYDGATPITVANFKKYIDTGRYFTTDPTTKETASSFVHRSVPDFVIQGGGYLSTVDPVDPVHIQPTAVTAFSSIKNEPGISNIRGTISMAKLPDAPDSATSQWFINLVDNLFLDTDNGGYTVFGRVLGTGMTVVDAIAALPVYDASALYGSAFTQLPLRNFTSDLPSPENLVTLPKITYISSLTFTATSDNPTVATAAVSESNLLVSGKLLGTAKITVTATDVDGAKVSTSFDVTVVTNPVHLANISTRAVVGTGDAALIGGFIVLGDAPKPVIIRAIGPSLADSGLTGYLADPILEIHDGTGALIASNDDWQDDENSQSVIDFGIPPSEPKESAIFVTLPADPAGLGYTAVVHGANNGTGVGLVEVYDVDSGPGASVLNISTRSDVQTGDNVLIGGFIVNGEGSQRVLIRAIGPSLAGSVANPLSDTTLTLYDAHGVQIDFNDDWQDNPAKDEIIATTIPPIDPKESALLQVLAPGAYTATVRGAANATGTALVEAYALGP